MIWKPHVTVAAIIEEAGKFLMVEELSEGELVINQPAGHLDPDESLIDAVIRETREETAWTFRPDHITGIYLWKHEATQRTYLRVSFCGEHLQHDPEQVLDEGIVRAVWLDREELLAQQHRLRSPLVMHCIDDYLAQQRYPLDMLNTIQES